MMLLDRRRSGVLLHPTSLPSRFGIGDLGPAVSEFLHFLAGACQSVWQVLPLGPTGFGDSPYASPSAFAGNALLISPELLVERGWVLPDELGELAHLSADRVDYTRLVPFKNHLLKTAYQRARPGLAPRLERFREQHAAWLEDFALFSALQHEQGGAWTGWDSTLRARNPDALARARRELADRIEYVVFCQLIFAEQWAAVRAQARALDIAVVGDIPVFVAHDSADVWANQHLFKLDGTGQPIVVAGVPPDYFSTTGQLWGNPLYDWQAMAGDGYAWWIARFRHLLELVDLVRIDHFRGFEAAWEVPAGASTAVGGAWVKGPGVAAFDAIRAGLGGGQPPVIAEDLGLITDEVRELLKATGFPGMKVLQFAFGGGPDNPYLPHNYSDANCVVYTGTHDNDSTRGWYASTSDAERTSAQRYVGTDGSRIAHDLLRLALGSTANTAIVPLQDVLELGSEARMNTPGSVDSNWAWRVLPDQLDQDHAHGLAELTSIYGRSQSAQ